MLGHFPRLVASENVHVGPSSWRPEITRNVCFLQCAGRSTGTWSNSQGLPLTGKSRNSCWLLPVLKERKKKKNEKESRGQKSLALYVKDIW